MARIFITGSADGLGQLAAQQLVQESHQVVLHARNQKRGEEALEKVPGAEGVVTGDLSSTEETIQLATETNSLGTFDAVIHNAGVYEAASELIFSVNSLAPYILTCLMHRPKRLIYMSSGLHTSGNADLRNLSIDQLTYSTSKLHNVMLTMAVARKWPEVFSNAVNPGWVPTKMGGANATGDLQKGYQTQAWLAVSNEPEARVAGKYFYHQQVKQHRSEADDPAVQEEFMEICEQHTGVRFPI